MRHPRTRKLVSLALTLGALAGLWHFFAPTAIGGSANYVVTDGISMEPRFHSGDLAVVRSQGTYHVGEIVAYYNKEFHTIVLHRIVGRAGARYVFKGDNNNFVDFEHPAGSQLIGALWLHLPGVGGTLASIRSPALIGVLTALGTLLLAGGVFTRRRGRRRRAARAAAGEALALAAQPRGPVEWAAGLIAALTLALLAFVLLALLAFTRPPTQRLPYAVRYEQSGTLTYTAQANPGPTYANGVAVTGEPLFTHVINTAELRFAYEFHSPTPSRLDGTAWLDAQIASSSGWQTTLRLGQPTHFQGEHALVSAPLGLSALEQLVRSVQDTTGVSGADTLTVIPHVNIGGSVSALPLHTDFSPQIRFTLTPLELEPTAPVSATSTTGQPPANQFNPSSSGSVTGKRAEQLSLSFGVVRLAVASARVIALSGIAVVILLLAGLLAFLRGRPRDEAASISSRYARLIVPVAHVSPLPGVGIIDVADMDALARIAEHYDRSILHESTATADAFWVSDESGQFRYVVDGPPAVAAVSATDARTVDGPPAAAAVSATDARTAEFAAVRAPADEGHTIELTRIGGDTAEAAYAGPLGQGPVEEVYADEAELGVIAYESGRADVASRAGSPKRPNRSPSLPAWTGWSG